MATSPLTTSKGSPNPSSGQNQHVVVGVVKDNVDPEELGRILVEFPTLGAQSFWIRQSSPNGGSGRGLYALPEKEDEVVVAFMEGSVNHGVIIGQMWNGTDKPPTEAKDGMPKPDKTKWDSAKWSKELPTEGSQDLSQNDRRFWRSRSGHLMVFDDTSGSETVQMWDKSHSMGFVFDSAKGAIFLTNTNGDLHIRTKGDMYFEAGKNIKWIAAENIEGESGKDTIHEAKMNYKLKTGQNIETTSTMNTTMTAKQNFSAKASLNFSAEGLNTSIKGKVSASFKGGASTTVKGAMVMIN